MNKLKVILSILAITLLVSVIFFESNGKSIILDNVSLQEKENSTSGMFAIMVENDDGDYVEYTDSDTFPTDMLFNSSLSSCINNDGNTVDNVLSYSNGIISVNTGETVYCYVYFDIYELNCVDEGVTSLSECILRSENNFQTEDAAITYIKSKGTPDFSSTATTDEGLYYTTDDYGDSYYFRGAVTDNYVYFAGFYWRIIRINGDGSIRMIYDGTSAHSNATSTGYADRYISKSVFNTLYGSNALVGYMYGEAFTENATTSTTQTLQSYYYYYASTYTFDTDTGYFTLGDDASRQVWNSSLAGYYTCGSTSTKCTTLYYISSYTNNYQGTYYTYTSTSETVDDVTTYTESQGTSTTTGTFATRYYYGTGYSYDSSNGYTLTGYAYNVYDGTGTTTDLTGYYTCGSTSYYGCTTMYHIESGSTAQIANVTKYTLTTNDYATTHSNIYDSTIKGVVDSWYETNIYNKTDGTNSYDDYISDTLFCNDRSISGTTTTTYYGARTRLYGNNSPVLTCTNQNDRFTVDDEVNGNGDLTYKVGLITADEESMAGGVSNTSNTSYYLYIGYLYWTMSPFSFVGTYAREWAVSSTNGIGGNNVNVSYGVRPVINLSSSVILISGDGSIDSPYTVSLQ